MYYVFVQKRYKTLFFCYVLDSSEIRKGRITHPHKRLPRKRKTLGYIVDHCEDPTPNKMGKGQEEGQDILDPSRKRRNSKKFGSDSRRITLFVWLVFL